MCSDGDGTIPTPANGYSVTSNMGHRDTGIPGASTWHKGTDYATPCGTAIEGPPEGCVNMEGGSSTSERGGYGYTAKFDCGNGIQIQYAHLQSANSYNPDTNTISTGNSGVGGCHLDYIITIDGKTVDAQCATGTVTPGSGYRYGNSSTRHGHACPVGGQPNLCDAATREALRNHSDQIFSGSGGRNNYSIEDGATSGGGGDDGGGGGGDDGGGGGGSGDPGGDPPPGAYDVPEIPQPFEEDEDDPVPGAADPYVQSSRTPVCSNSVCISESMVEVANLQEDDGGELICCGFVDKVITNLAKIDPPEAGADCKPPHYTNLTTYRQATNAFDRETQAPVGRIDKYADAFCLQQGCSYVKERTAGGVYDGAEKCE